MKGRRRLTARIGLTIVATMVVSLALLALPAAPAAAAPATVTVNGHGQWAEVVAKTDKPMKFIFAASAAFNYNPSCPHWDEEHVAFGGPTDFWIAPVTNLEPGTLYTYRLEVIDPTGRGPRSCQSGQFRTAKPSVLVSFDTAEIIDDGDDLASGAGELLFYLGTNGAFHDQLQVGWLDADSGTTVHLNKSIVRTNFIGNDSISMSVRVAEEDCSWGEFCTYGSPGTEISPAKDFGEESDYYWITGHAGPFFILLDDFDPDNSKPRPFTITLKYGKFNLHVVVHGTYRVTYD